MPDDHVGGYRWKNEAELAWVCDDSCPHPTHEDHDPPGEMSSTAKPQVKDGLPAADVPDVGTLPDMAATEIAAQDDLLAQAQQAPGVKEAAEIYELIAPHLPRLPQFTTTVASYATGANS